MALKLGYYHPAIWQTASTWRGQAIPPPHAIVALEQDALVGLLGYELGDGSHLVLTCLEVNPALIDDDSAAATDFLCRAAVQLGKMMCRRVVWAGQALEKVAPQRSKSGGGQEGQMETSNRDVPDTSGAVNNEEVDW